MDRNVKGLAGFRYELGIRIRIFALRQCADYARASYAGAGEARVARVTFAVEVAVWCL